MTIRPLSSIFILIFFIFVFLSACVSRQKVASEYREASHTVGRSHQTVIFFLIDGLSLDLFKKHLNQGRLPNIGQYFIGEKRQFYVARTGFPSMTFPALGALLSEKPSGISPVIGNLMMRDGDEIDFESPWARPIFNKLLNDRNIFSRLSEKGLRSVSLDYAYGNDASVHLDPVDLRAANSILKKNYGYIDDKIIASLKLLLKKNPSSKWPEFIFVHLVGVDFLSHDFGPYSKEAANYLDKLDSQLSDVLEILKEAELRRERKIVALLSSDHGFDKTVEETIEFEKLIRHFDPKIKILNEGRMAGLFFPKNWQREDKENLARTLLQNLGLEIVAFKELDHIYIQNQKIQVDLRFEGSTPYKKTCAADSFMISVNGKLSVCPEKLNGKDNGLFYPYFISNLAYYFQNKESLPDMIVITRSGVALRSHYKGQHGGPTSEEVLVPLLIRNGHIDAGSYHPPLWNLLNFL